MSATYHEFINRLTYAKKEEAARMKKRPTHAMAQRAGFGEQKNSRSMLK